MDDRKLRDLLERELEVGFSGWDFSRIGGTGRMQESVLPWNYRSIAKKYAAGRACLLDMGTGGGEFLDSLDFLPERVFATEGYAPNFPIARKRLEAKGIVVKEIGDDARLPFEDSFFDIVINRHEAFDAAELKRILMKGGVFVTQQVGGLNAIDLTIDLGGRPGEKTDEYFLLRNIERLEASGMEILESDENIGRYRFFDIGAVAYYLKCIPWQLPDFSLDKHFPKLRLLSAAIDRKGFIDFIDHRFYLAARSS